MSQRPDRIQHRPPGRAARRAGRSRPRKGRPSPLLYAAAVAVVLVVGAGLLWASRSTSGDPKPARNAAASSAEATTASSRPATAPVTDPAAEDVSGTPLPAADDAAAVKAAAVRYPDAPPVSPETIRKADPGRKLVAITIDDGIPFDTRLLDYLESRNVRCTTFMLGQAVKAHPDAVKRLNDGGFEIANHTWDHKTLTKLSDDEIRSELVRCQDSITAITGNQAPYMRPPGGGTSKRVEAVAADMGFKVVMWNKSFADTSKYATSDKLFHNVMDGLEPGDIILCHWGGKSTYEAMQLIIPEMEKRGFTPVTLSELLESGPDVTQGRDGEGGAAGAIAGT